MSRLSLLLIAKGFMREVQRIWRATTCDSLPLPCEYFDLIYGTSTGGSIPIMPSREKFFSQNLRLVSSSIAAAIC